MMDKALKIMIISLIIITTLFVGWLFYSKSQFTLILKSGDTSKNLDFKQYENESVFIKVIGKTRMGIITDINETSWDYLEGWWKFYIEENSSIRGYRKCPCYVNLTEDRFVHCFMDECVKEAN